MLGLSLFALPLEAATITVRAGDNLQAALDRAQLGDTVALERGATFTGVFVLADKGPIPTTVNRRTVLYITVRTAITDTDAALSGWRITPARALNLAKVRAAGPGPVLRTAPGAHHWRLELLEIQGNGGGNLVELGDGSSAQDNLAQVPHDLAIDRCYIHGDPDRGQKRGVALNSASTSITGSYISDIKVVGQDAQAIAGWNGPGPFRIENNYLEAAGENFLLGGAIPGIANLVPSDVVFSRNHVTRPVAWRGENWQIKNLFELKAARRVLVEGNIFENNWQAAQPGYAILMTPAGQDGKAAWVVVEDVTFRYNIVRHTAAGVNVRGHDEGPSGLAQRLIVTDNLFYGLDKSAWGGNGFFLLIGDGAQHVNVSHNTVIQSGNVISAYGGTSSNPVAIGDFVFTNNLTLHNAYGVIGQGQSIGTGSLNAYFPDALFEGNVLAGGRASRYPANNLFPEVDAFTREFVNYQEHDYRLAAGSQYRGAGTDRRDIGADITRVLARTSGVEEGRPESEGTRAIPRFQHP